MVNAYFLDTSALVKRYVPEIGSNWIQSINDGAANNDLTISQITWVELHPKKPGFLPNLLTVTKYFRKTRFLDPHP